MNPLDKPQPLSLELSLEPIADPAAAGVPKPAPFHADTRHKVKTERRVTADRREVIRFQDDRRCGKDRRPKKSWEPGSNL